MDQWYFHKKSYQNQQWILTPHPGEAARLLKTTKEKIQADRFAAVEKIQAKYGGVCVLICLDELGIRLVT